MDGPWRIEMLGGLRAFQGDRVVTRFRTQKTGSLLAYLARQSRHTRPIPREAVCELLWPDTDPEAARHSLCTALSSLRHHLEPPGEPYGRILMADRFSVRLNPEVITVDANAFEVALRAGEAATGDDERARHTRQALDLYRGEFLHGYYDNWVIREQEYLSDLFFGGVHWLIDYLHRAGDDETAILYAEQAIRVDTFVHETVHRDLIALLASAGRAAEAVQQYRELERLLRERLQMAPSPATRRVVKDIECSGTLPSERALPPEIPTAPTPAAPKVPAAGTLTFIWVAPEGTDGRIAAGLWAEVRKHGGQAVPPGEWRADNKVWAAAFPHALDAASCASALQRWLGAPGEEKDRAAAQARIALHAGDVEREGEGYRGRVLEESPPLLAAAHLGQVLCSEPVAALIRHDLEPGMRLLHLGLFEVPDIEQPVRLFQLDADPAAGMVARSFPPPVGSRAYSCNLPIPFTRFIGRARSLERLREIVVSRETRLVTLTGTGGCGKTRLALEAARTLLSSFGGRVWYVPLADLTDAGQAPEAIREALNLAPAPPVGTLEQVAAALDREPSLLVLDNFEHLVEGGVGTVQALLQSAPTLTVLVTSRRVLGLTGEREFPVDPLPVPVHPEDLVALAACESIQLFVDRAQAARPDFELTAQNARALALLCRMLEGIPLAIELAAARAQVLTPGQIVRRMEHRGDFLVSRRRDVAPRHRTLRAPLDWSYRLLPPELQRFFCRLSVFRGSWDLEAAEAVCAEPMALDYLADLRDCSLVLARDTSRGMRFHMLDTVRDYAAEALPALPDSDGTWERFGTYYLALARQCAARLRTPGEREAIRACEPDLTNLREAMDLRRQQGCWAETAELALLLARFLVRLGLQREAAERLEAGLEAAKAMNHDRALTAGLLRERASVDIDLFRWVEAGESAEAAVAIFTGTGDRHGEADGYNLLGMIAAGESRPEAAREHYGRALALFRETHDGVGMAIVHNNMALLAEAAGEGREAEHHLQAALHLWRGCGDERGLSETLVNLGVHAHRAGRLEEARRYYLEGLRVEGALGNRLGVGITLLNLGEIAEQSATGGGDAGRAEEMEKALLLFSTARSLLDQAGSPYAGTAEEALRRVLHVPAEGGRPLENLPAAVAPDASLEEIIAAVLPDDARSPGEGA